MWINMKPFTNQVYGPKHISYTIGVTAKNTFFDQKNSLHELRPGYQTTIHVVPKILRSSTDFDSLELKKRKCKLPHESYGFNYFHKYSRKACETECSLRKATAFCQCLPWYIPNNFTSLPMCDMFGGFCFNKIMSNEVYYKKCKLECLPNCRETSLAIWQRTFPLNVEELCKDNTYFDKFFKQNFQKIFAFEQYRILVQEQRIPDIAASLSNGSLCMDYLRRYVSFVSVESPTTSVSISKLEKRLSFYDQLGIIGGNLAICVGMSLMSIFELVLFIYIVFKSATHDLNGLRKRMMSFLRLQVFRSKKKASFEGVIVCNYKRDKKQSEHHGFEETQNIRNIYVSTTKLY